MAEYEALIQNLRNIDEYDTGYAKLIYDAADAIEELSRRCEQFMYTPPSAWIPVTERLPKEMVLAHGRDGDIRSLEYSFTKKWWEDDDGYYCDTNYVTHWMPLPEPPKEET